MSLFKPSDIAKIEAELKKSYREVLIKIEDGKLVILSVQKRKL